jgi:isopentenyldiphosphate isomerase
MPELLDVVDPSGKPLARAKPRTAVHKDGDWHRTVHVWIVNNKGELLFQSRSREKESFPVTWDVSSAGHVSSGESPVAAAKKELFEELGIRAAAKQLHRLFSVATSSVQHKGKFIDNEISDVFLLRKNVPVSGLVLQCAEVADARYFPVSILRRIGASPYPDFAPHSEEYHLLFKFLSDKNKGRKSRRLFRP